MATHPSRGVPSRVLWHSGHSDVSQLLMAWVSPSGHQQPLDCALHRGTSSPVSPSRGAWAAQGCVPFSGDPGLHGAVSPGCVPFFGDPGLHGAVPRLCHPMCAVQGARPLSGCPNPNKGLRLLLIPPVLLGGRACPGCPHQRGHPGAEGHDSSVVTPEATLLESPGQG